MPRNTPDNPFYHPIIDCDIHNELPGLDTLIPYLEEHWVAYINESAFVGPNANDYPARAPTSARKGTKPKNGPPGSDFELLKEQTLDAWDVEIGILTCAYRVQSVHNEDLSASLATAINQWQIDAWVKQRRPIACIPRSAQPKSGTRRTRNRAIRRPPGLCSGHSTRQIISTLWQELVRPII